MWNGVLFLTNIQPPPQRFCHRVQGGGSAMVAFVAKVQGNCSVLRCLPSFTGSWNWASVRLCTCDLLNHQSDHDGTMAGTERLQGTGRLLLTCLPLPTMERSFGDRVGGATQRPWFPREWRDCLVRSCWILPCSGFVLLDNVGFYLSMLGVKSVPLNIKKAVELRLLPLFPSAVRVFCSRYSWP